MIDRLMELYHQYFNQFTTWYNASDFFTQVIVFVISGIAVLLILGVFFMSKALK
jgi:hypothetical protein